MVSLLNLIIDRIDEVESNEPMLIIDRIDEVDNGESSHY
ncbi:Uncharacterised protein [Anaerobiospirillum thomasii]|uniref:Uncharacterized protein n=1 Tax=Anaerobiospirillum thomasii TaxID=179995 RepID=A0A2X0V7F9_9GAMM|nr:Uncharacterised protein [Anaerobiospirillum thomasii]